MECSVVLTIPNHVIQGGHNRIVLNLYKVTQTLDWEYDKCTKNTRYGNVATVRLYSQVYDFCTKLHSFIMSGRDY